MCRFPIPLRVGVRYPLATLQSLWIISRRGPTEVVRLRMAKGQEVTPVLRLGLGLELSWSSRRKVAQSREEEVSGRQRELGWEYPRRETVVRMKDGRDEMRFSKRIPVNG
jgi:hypothetical protein